MDEVEKGKKGIELWQRFFDFHRRHDETGAIDGIEYLPQACEGILWECLFCGELEGRGHKPDCILIEAMDLFGEKFYVKS